MRIKPYLTRDVAYDDLNGGAHGGHVMRLQCMNNLNIPFIEGKRREKNSTSA